MSPATFSTPHRQGAQRLLVACVRSACSSRRTDLEELLRDEIDWPYFEAIAVRHDVVSLVLRELEKKRLLSTIPGPVGDSLRNKGLARIRATLAQLRELVRVGRMLNRAQIPFVPFKGPHLGATLYDGATDRCCGDVDLLVQPRHLSSAAVVLRKAGYRPVRNHDIESLIKSPLCFHLRFLGSDPSAIVELHWEISYPFFGGPLLTDSFWAEGGRAQWRGVSVRTLSPEWLAILLSVHGARHLWCSLKWVKDLSQLIERSPRLDWDAVLAKAQEPVVRRMLWLSLQTVQTLMGVDLPAHILDAVRRDRIAVSLSDEIVRNTPRIGFLSRPRQLLCRARLQPTWLRTWWFMAHSLCMPLPGKLGLLLLRFPLVPLGRLPGSRR